jgi:DNA polymerase I
VNDCVFLYKPAYMGNAVDVLGPKEVCEKWDISNVDQVVDILGLQGDSSDNIPGVPGIGPKTAAALLKTYGSVENIVAHTAELKGKQKELFTQFGEQALLSKKLARIVTDVPIDFNEEELVYRGPEKTVLTPIFDDLEFKAIAARAFGDPVPVVARSPQSAQLTMFGGAGDEASAVSEADVDKKTFDSSEVQYQTVEGLSQCKALVQRLQEQPVISIYALLSEPNPIDAEFKAMAFHTLVEEVRNRSERSAL